MTSLPFDERTGKGALAEIVGLTIDFRSGDGWTNVVNRLNLRVFPGEAVGLVGESGCGKTTTAFALMGQRRAMSRIREGQVWFAGHDLLQLAPRELRRIRGRQISYVPQNPTTALSPGIRILDQIVEAMAVHGLWGTNDERRDRARELLSQVHLPDPAIAGRKYPHQLSGGQQQRVSIAIALACSPQLVVLDEPTTGLDVTTQAEILALLRRLRAEHNMAFLYVTHNLGVVAQLCDRVAVLYAGELVEVAPTEALFGQPSHPYTRGLIKSVPSIAEPDKKTLSSLRGLLQREQLAMGCRFAARCDFALSQCFVDRQELQPVAPNHSVACWRWSEAVSASGPGEASARLLERATSTDAPLLEVDGLTCSYGSTRRGVFRHEPNRIIRNVSFEVGQEETLAIVGESGSGKSTIVRAISGLLQPLSGTIRFQGADIGVTIQRRSERLRREIQFVLQNPDASLNPRHRVSKIIGRPIDFFWKLGGAERARRLAGLLEDVHLDDAFGRRYPNELSGGERQRVAIARALAARPRLMLCDEILSALDVSVQAGIIDLLRALQRAQGIAYLFISHDLAVVRSLSHRVVVLYRGQACEIGLTEEVFSPPFHPYTSALLAAVPEIKRRNRPTLPQRTNSPSRNADGSLGCPFTARCALKIDAVCDNQPPPWRPTSTTHAVRCHRSIEELRTLSVLPNPTEDATL
jgi:peptide/nickel transport system ATP-binding protein